jgi:putative ABC transport system permease protein
VKVIASLRTAFRELWAHQLRSLLTMLGVVFGVGSVIAMVSIGAGARYEALEQIKQLGVDVVRVQRRALTGEIAAEALKKSPNGLTYGDSEALRTLCRFAQEVVPVCRVFADATVDGQQVPARVFGTTNAYARVSRLTVARGRFIVPGDIVNSRRVCVLGAGVKRLMLPLVDPVGRTITLTNEEFRVVGVLAERRALSAGGSFALADINEDIYLPITTAMDYFPIYLEQVLPADIDSFYTVMRRMRQRPPLNERSVTSIIMQVSNPDQTVEAARVIRNVTDRRHNGTPDYEIMIPAELLRQRQQAQRIFNIVMGTIASISLVVGGIGIMNIMLATVSQRAREIGIRRCIGASRLDIVGQFLIEALVMTGIGGLLGIGAGVGLANAISSYAKWKTVVSSEAVEVSVIVAGATGLLFGLYPAIRAAAIQPVEALRTE